MLQAPPSVLINAKKTIDIAAKPINLVHEFLNSFDPQQKNQFICLITPEIPPNITTFADTALQIARSVLDATTLEFYVQNLDIPVTGIEYSRFDNLQAVQDITWADEVNLTFIEGELSPVRTFLQNWQSLTFERNLSPTGGYVFNDNQWLGRKKIIILPMMRTKIPNTVWIEIRGARFKSMDNFQFDQQSPDPMMIGVQLAVDGVYLNSLI